ncbi:MAG: hypothetical protein CM15mP83_0520 [Flavobacteriaceae bacterium]|nr:MAG: hypothetical protein CM15mP83_0520 [Flavobacteriaceae bacterium]
MRGSVTALQGDASQRIRLSIRIRKRIDLGQAAMIVPVGRAKSIRQGFFLRTNRKNFF